MARTLLGWLVSSCVLGLGGVVQAAPVVLDFGSGIYMAPPTFDPPYSEDGFRFSTLNLLSESPEQDHFDILDFATLGTGPEREASIHTGNDSDQVVVDFFGAPFALLSLEIELLDDPDGGVWEIVASNGKQATFTGPGTRHFGVGWGNITSFTLRSTSTPMLSDLSGQLYFDDVRLDTEPRVPAPGAASLLLAGAAAWIARSRLG